MDDPTYPRYKLYILTSRLHSRQHVHHCAISLNKNIPFEGAKMLMNEVHKKIGKDQIVALYLFMTPHNGYMSMCMLGKHDQKFTYIPYTTSEV